MKRTSFRAEQPSVELAARPRQGGGGGELAQEEQGGADAALGAADGPQCLHSRSPQLGTETFETALPGFPH